ncbi:unnamed protein product [Ixodes hexagonus]
MEGPHETLMHDLPFNSSSQRIQSGRTSHGEKNVHNPPNRQQTPTVGDRSKAT